MDVLFCLEGPVTEHQLAGHKIFCVQDLFVLLTGLNLLL